METTGDVRQWAGPRIVTTTGDRLPYYCETEVPRANLPYTVEVGVRSIAVGTVLVRHRYPGLRMPRWRQARRLTLPAHAEPPGPAEGREFFVRLESAGGTPVEYSAVLIYDTQAVELSRILHAEAGASLEGMRAIAHVIANRMRTGTPAAQVDTTSPWPESFINTGFLLNAARPRADWPRVTSTAARLLARAIIRQGGVAGADPTEGARFYRSAGAPGLETTRPAFIRLRESVEAGDLRRVTVGGNVFYAPVAEAP